MPKNALSQIKLSIRELLGLLAIVALAVTLWLTKVENSNLRQKLELLSPETHILLYSGNPLREKYSTNSSIGVTGRLFPLSLEFDSEPTVVGRLVNLETGKTITETVEPISSNPQGKGFGFTLRPDSVLSPGCYIVEVRVFDGEQELAKTNVVKHVIDPAIFNQPHDAD